MDRTQAYWICQFGGWGLYGLLTAVVFGLQVGWNVHLVTNTASAMVVGIGVTHAFRAFVHRTGWTDRALKTLVPRIIAACLVLALLYTGLNDLLVWAGLRTPVGFEETNYWSGVRLAFSLFGSLIILFPWLAIYFGVHSFWNYRQAEIDKWKLEAQAETARLKALKLQLNPHFFFNSLNSVRALIAEDPDRAQRMVTRLARLLRNTLQVDDVKTVSLKEELDTVRTYLELETVRFEERLQYEINASEAALDRPVPFCWCKRSSRTASSTASRSGRTAASS
jgi:Putative regulator of cell autolysis